MYPHFNEWLLAKLIVVPLHFQTSSFLSWQQSSNTTYGVYTMVAKDDKTIKLGL